MIVLTNSSTIARNEGDQDVIVCAMINSPAGGLASQTVTVQFSITGHQDIGRAMSLLLYSHSHYLKVLIMHL